MASVKSFISSPSPGLTLKEPGIYEITGVAYSGTGRIAGAAPPLSPIDDRTFG